MRVAVAADHPLATRTSVTLEELRDEPWLITEVGGTCADSNVVLHAFRDAGYEPNVRFASDDYQALQGMAASGIGVALIPTLALVSSRCDVVVLPLRGRAPARQIFAAVRTGEQNPLVEHMVESLRSAARTLAAAGPRSPPWPSRLRRSQQLGGDLVRGTVAVDARAGRPVAVVVDERLACRLVLAQAVHDHVLVSSARPRASSRSVTTSCGHVEEDHAVELQPSVCASLRGNPSST